VTESLLLGKALFANRELCVKIPTGTKSVCVQGEMKMKRTALAILMMIALAVSLLACYSNISQVRDKWGDPAKVEDRGDTIVYYYYFYQGRGVGYDPGDSGGITLGRVTTGIVVVEIITNREGKILKKRKYWKQPKVE